MVIGIHPQCALSRPCRFQAHLVLETRPPSGSSCVGQFYPPRPTAVSVTIAAVLPARLQSRLHALGLDRKELRAWAMYDWANSAFNTTVMAAVLPIYYYRVAAVGVEEHLRTAYWGYTQTIALLIIAALAPVLGAAADYAGRKKSFLAGFVGIGVVGAALLSLVGEGDWMFASAVFIVGNIGFALRGSLLRITAASRRPPGRNRPGLDSRVCDGLRRRRAAVGGEFRLD